MTSLQSEYALEDTNFPALRFKEFSDNWEDSKLGEICEFLQGVQVDLEFQISNQKEGYIKFLRIENYTQNSLDFRFIPINLSKNKFIDLDDIVVVRYGATAGFISRGHSGVLANNLFKIIPNENKLDKNYLFLLLKSDKVFKFFQLAMAGGAMPALSFKIVGVLPLSFPSLPEQTKVANFLTAVDEKITLLTQKADLLSQYKKGVMQQIFSQELRFKDDDGQEFPEWEEKTLGEIADVKGGKRLAKGYSLQHENNGMPYITVSDMYQGGVDLKNIKYVPSEIAESIKNYKISINDIFISVAGTLGIVGIIPIELDNANLTENANKLTNLKCNQKYLLQYLMSDKFGKLIDSVKTTNAQPKLAIYAINSFVTFLPSSIEEQTKIANFLTAVDDKITNNQNQLDAVKQYKHGLLQQMFV